MRPVKNTVMFDCGACGLRLGALAGPQGGQGEDEFVDIEMLRVRSGPTEAFEQFW